MKHDRKIATNITIDVKLLDELKELKDFNISEFCRIALGKHMDEVRGTKEVPFDWRKNYDFVFNSITYKLDYMKCKVCSHLFKNEKEAKKHWGDAHVDEV